MGMLKGTNLIDAGGLRIEIKFLGAYGRIMVQ
jgi:hypothetical protein